MVAPDSYAAQFQSYVHGFVVSLAQARGLEVIDVASELRSGQTDPGTFHPNEGHFTSAGHVSVADTILQALDQLRP